jgi:hypothetical protein
MQQIVFPYSKASFTAVIQTPNVFYVDKSHFIPKLEAYGDALILLAPRRFGKSIFLDMLANYYDKNIDDTQFQKLFGNLHIGKHPTELRGKFHVLKLDFSKGLVTDSVETFNRTLQSQINAAVLKFYLRYPDFPRFQPPHRNLPNFGVLAADDLLEGAQVAGLPVRPRPLASHTHFTFAS